MRRLWTSIQGSKARDGEQPTESAAWPGDKLAKPCLKIWDRTFTFARPRAKVDERQSPPCVEARRGKKAKKEIRNMRLRGVMSRMWICWFVVCCQGCGKPGDGRNERISRFEREVKQHFASAQVFSQRQEFVKEIAEYTTIIDMNEEINKEEGKHYYELVGWRARLNRAITYSYICKREHPHWEPLPQLPKKQSPTSARAF